MPDDRPIIAWLRRDLRLGDHPMLHAAFESGRPVIPVFLRDEVIEGQGAAPRWRLSLSIGAFGRELEAIGSRLVLRHGRAAEALARLVDETGAAAIWWTRAYDPASRARDEEVERESSVETRVFPGHVLFEPWSIETGSGGYYKVYTPYWRATRHWEVQDPLPRVPRLRPPERWPRSDTLNDWALGADMQRGAEVVARHVRVGEAAAQDRLAGFIEDGIADYEAGRNLPAVNGTSGLSENLTYGEISIRTCWHAARRAEEEGRSGASTWLKELIWREFAYHLLWYTPRLVTGNWRPEWDDFPWRDDNGDAMLWRQGRTGMPFVDAAMREMFVTGRMHNRSRMIVASYLTKHLMTHWRVGCRWFEECLTDWDVANNALGWQWVAGSGPDASPFFRVFNPATQLQKFDPERAYVGRWIAEGQRRPGEDALSYFDAIPLRWNMSPDDAYPAPLVSAAAGRQRALDAYAERRD
ncbi:cryptochrome/photolyase family protein [Roseitranquillus sediminis]|uniref:cryptochrome/photolyase family protein n=1 Tax=Roseitranquillus sediminis TaxID=2809051 RepID=UPI001D0CD615|nr:deoxyribodipyrimidine photo-lyase [Roseitranquillus sediminis]MBM9595700.1 deoxyribodipyrimidine photo-lyase [Roseitranquillus sediminis]